MSTQLDWCTGSKGFAEVDIDISKHLWSKLEETCPFFYHRDVPAEVIPQHMLDYLKW